MVDRGDRSYIAPVHINAKAFLSHVDCYVVSYVYTFVGSTLKWVLPTTLRVYGLRPSGKTRGSAYGLRPSGKTRGSASDRMTNGGLCICSSILICSLMPSWIRALHWKSPASCFNF